MRIAICGMLLVLVGALPGYAQQRRAQPAPVDQGVSDVDPLAQSLRRVERGNALFTPEGRVYRIQDNARSVWQQLNVPTLDLMQPRQTQARPFRYEAPGVSANLRRPEYAPSPRSGEQRPIVPPDTVFDLVPHPNQPTGPAQPDAPQSDESKWVDRRIDTRIDTRLNNSVDNRVPQQPHTSQHAPQTQTPQAPDTPAHPRTPQRPSAPDQAPDARAPSRP